MNRSTAAKRVFESRPIVINLGRRKVTGGESCHLLKAALVLSHIRRRVGTFKAVEHATADVAHLNAAQFSVLQFQRDDALLRVNRLYCAETDGVPQLSAHHVDAVEPEFWHLQELPYHKRLHLSVSVLVYPCTTASDKTCNERAYLHALLRRNLTLRHKTLDEGD